MKTTITYIWGFESYLFILIRSVFVNKEVAVRQRLVRQRGARLLDEVREFTGELPLPAHLPRLLDEVREFTGELPLPAHLPRWLLVVATLGQGERS